MTTHHGPTKPESFQLSKENRAHGPLSPLTLVRPVDNGSMSKRGKEREAGRDGQKVVPMASVGKSDLVGPEVLAEYFKVSRNTILNWGKDGKLPCVRIGKIYRFSMKKVLETVNCQFEAA